MPPITFASLGIAPELVDCLAARGITTPTPVQAATLPDALAGRDVSGCAPTGSGKTLAFGLAVVEPCPPGRTPAAPSPRARPHPGAGGADRRRADPARPTAGPSGRAFNGGVAIEPQRKAFRRGVDIAVACPGRLADLIARGAVDLAAVEIVVVDEADRMADMGFLPEVRRLLDATRPDRQTLLFSATLDGDVDVLVRRYQRNPVRHEVAPPERALVDHHLWLVGDADRTERTAELISGSSSTMVFTRTRHGADRLVKRLGQAGVGAVAIHGGRSQGQRDAALDAFRQGRVRAIVATDVAARGLHVDAVACVLHYDLPAEAKDYLHRSGRTGRAGAEGMVVSMVAPQQRAAATKLMAAAGVEASVSSPPSAGASRAEARPHRPVHHNGRRTGAERRAKAPRAHQSRTRQP